MAITKEGSGSPDLPLKSNFVSEALKCLSKRGPEGRGRTTRPTLNTQRFPHGCCRLHRLPPTQQTQLPSKWERAWFWGDGRFCPTLWKLRPEESVSRQPAFPRAHSVKLKQMQQGPGSRLAYSQGYGPSEGESPSVWGDTCGTSACSYLDNC